MKLRLTNKMSIRNYLDRENAYSVLDKLTKEDLMERYCLRIESLSNKMFWTAILTFFIGVWIGSL